MKIIGLIALAVLLFAGQAEAQATPQSVDLSKAYFRWQYTGPPVDEFRIKCGPASGTYPILRVVLGGAAREDRANLTIKNNGVYYCILTSANKYGESLPSNEIFFDGGVAGSISTSFQIGP